MTSETRKCQNCKSEFTIEPDDFVFYEKMGLFRRPEPEQSTVRGSPESYPPKADSGSWAPTFCYECRSRRRLLWRNERVLYKRKCQAPGHNEDLISIYSPHKKVTVYDQKYWWSDAWNPRDYGKEYDFSKPFFVQFKELFERAPLLALSNSNATNSDYCNVADQSKDSYLCSGSYKIERALYSNRIYTSRDCADMYVSFRNELCYECVSCTDSYRLLYSQNCVSCLDSYFLYDCRNCSHCVGCVNLRNKQYCIFNEQYSKEEYEKRLGELKLNSREGIEAVAREFEKLHQASIHKFARIYKAINCTGDNIDNAKNAKWCFDIAEGLEDGKYCHWGGLQTHDAYDSGPGLGDALDLAYEVVDTGLQSADIAFTNVVYGSQRIRYALYCHGCNDLFGCIGLRNQRYCLLNKQYTKEEYEELIPKVIRHMNEKPYIDKLGRVYKYGEFFPEEISPMAFNESVAKDYFPLPRQEVEERGYGWHEDAKRDYIVTMKPSDLPSTIAEAGADILKETIGCIHDGNCVDGCTTAFRLTSNELNFYRHLDIPLPQLCFNCRHAKRLKQRNPLKLWHRKCMCSGITSDVGRPTSNIYQNTAEHFHGKEHCPNEFETSYAPERSEIVYCEQCYNAEVV